MSDELQTEQQPVEAARPVIKSGKLRERVKKGELQAKDVLAWLREQEGPISESFVTWLKNFQPRKPKEEKVEEEKEKKPKKHFRKGARNGRTMGRRSNQNSRRQRDGKKERESKPERGSDRPDRSTAGSGRRGKGGNDPTKSEVKS